MLELELVVVFLGFGPKADFFKLHRVLLFLSRFILFRLLVKVFPVIHYATDRRPYICGDLHEIETFSSGDFKGLLGRDYPDLRTVFIDQPDFRNSDPAICPDAWFVSYVKTSILIS
jgi:hypothetical protein